MPTPSQAYIMPSLQQCKRQGNGCDPGMYEGVETRGGMPTSRIVMVTQWQDIILDMAIA